MDVGEASLVRERCIVDLYCKERLSLDEKGRRLSGFLGVVSAMISEGKWSWGPVLGSGR